MTTHKPTTHISVSVIVPIYNVEKHIQKCAESLFEQTLDKIEFIFINDCTPDKSMDVLHECIQKYPELSDKIKIITHTNNSGLATSRNDGIKAASGDYVIHCDADDWVEKNMYEDMYRKAIKENADIVTCDYFAEYQSKQIYHPQPAPTDKKLFIGRLLSGSLRNFMWNKLIKRNLYEKLDFIWKDGVNMWEDVSVIIRLAYYANKMAYIPEAYYHYTQTNVNAYTKSWSSTSLDNIETAASIICTFFEQKGHEYSQDLLHFKLRTKYILLRHAPKERLNNYRYLYTEADSCINSQPAFSRIDKILLWNWMHSHNRIASGILYLIDSIKRLVR